MSKDKRTKAELLKEIASLKKEAREAHKKVDQHYLKRMELHEEVQQLKRQQATTVELLEQYQELAFISKRRADFNKRAAEQADRTLKDLLKLAPFTVSICPKCGRATKLRELDGTEERDPVSWGTALCGECHQDEPFESTTWCVWTKDGENWRLM